MVGEISPVWVWMLLINRSRLRWSIKIYNRISEKKPFCAQGSARQQLRWSSSLTNDLLTVNSASFQFCLAIANEVSIKRERMSLQPPIDILLSGNCQCHHSWSRSCSYQSDICASQVPQLTLHKRVGEPNYATLGFPPLS